MALLSVDEEDPTLDFDPEHLTRDYGAYYRSLGWQAISAHIPEHGGQWKRPIPDWTQFQNSLVSDDVFDNWFKNQHGDSVNVGVLTGKASGGLLVIDLDIYKSEKAMAWWHGLMQKHNNGMELETVMQMTGGGGLQLFFKAPEGTEGITVHSTDLDVDIRFNGGFAVTTPSRHISGKRYEWIDGCAPWEMEVCDAPQWLIDEIKALIVDHSRKAGGLGAAVRERTESPSDYFVQEGSLLPQQVRVDGREEDMTKRVWVKVLDLRRADPTFPSKVVVEAQITSCWGHYERATRSRLSNPNASNADLLEMEGRGISLMRQKFAAALKLWGTKVAQEAAIPNPKDEGVAAPKPPPPDPAPTAADWDAATPPPAPAPIEVQDPWDEPRPTVFPLHTLPAKIQRFIEATATDMGADPSAIAMSCLCLCSGALDQTFRLRMTRLSESQKEALKNAHLEQNWDIDEGWVVPLRLWVMLVAKPSSKKTPVLKALSRVLQRVHVEELLRYKQALKEWMDSKEGDEPKRTFYMVKTATVEAVGQIMSQQNRGLLLSLNEMSGWIEGMTNRRGSGVEKDKAFWAASYDGYHEQNDTIGRGSLYIHNFCTTIIGNIQPKALKDVKALTSNGLLQRFLPVMMLKGEKGQPAGDAIASAAWAQLQRDLIALHPYTMDATDEALEIFSEWQTESALISENTTLDESFQDFVGKLNGIHGSLAGILHLMDGKSHEPVTASAARRALTIMREFIIPHAVRFYNMISGDNGALEEIRKIGDFILISEKDRFTPSDFSSKVRLLKNMPPYEIAKRLSPLEAMGWLEVEESNKFGPPKAWRVKPGLRETLSARRAERREEKRQADALMNRYEFPPKKKEA